MSSMATTRLPYTVPTTVVGNIKLNWTDSILDTLNWPLDVRYQEITNNQHAEMWQVETRNSTSVWKIYIKYLIKYKKWIVMPKMTSSIYSYKWNHSSRRIVDNASYNMTSTKHYEKVYSLIFLKNNIKSFLYECIILDNK